MDSSNESTTSSAAKGPLDNYKVVDRGYKDGPCWEWQGGRHGREGHGQLWIRERNQPRRKLMAHVYFYEKLVGKIPANHDIHHRCKNKICVNPKHLVALDHIEHTTTHKITIPWKTVEKAISLYRKGWGVTQIGRELGVHRSHIGNIIHGRRRAEKRGHE